VGLVEMNVGVDEAGKHQRTAGIELPGRGVRSETAGGSDSLDPAPFNGQIAQHGRLDRVDRRAGETGGE
jgi:hypothetical protein